MSTEANKCIPRHLSSLGDLLDTVSLHPLLQSDAKLNYLLSPREKLLRGDSDLNQMHSFEQSFLNMSCNPFFKTLNFTAGFNKRYFSLYTFPVANAFFSLYEICSIKILIYLTE